MCSAAMTACTSGGCPEPVPLVSAIYMERVNCDEGGSCAIDDEMDMVTVEPDPLDPTRFSFFSLLRSVSGDAVLCGLSADYSAAGAGVTEQGTMVFDADASGYRRVASTTTPSGSGSCTGTASKQGPPGPPEPVGTCSTGSGGNGGSGGTGGCVPFSTDIGGTEQAPVIWEERYTCIDDSGACLGIENVEVTLDLIQDAERIDWSIAQGVGEGSEYDGELCEASFRWSSKPMTEAEDGCWEFTADRFNKRSFGAGFFCVGSGSKGAGSSPEPIPSCAEIAAANVDFTACPLPPPASPIQDGGS